MFEKIKKILNLYFISYFLFFSNIDISQNSPETANNFDDFNNMFKWIDRDDYTPDHIAFLVLKKVERERSQSRLDDAVEWFDEGYYYKIRNWVDDFEVGDIVD